MKKIQYKKILIRHVVPSGLRIIGHGFVTQQNYDPQHSSRLCRKYLRNQGAKHVVVNMVSPPQSPDLKAIELLWDELDRKIRKTYSTSSADLWNKLREAWARLERIQMHKSIERMS